MGRRLVGGTVVAFCVSALAVTACGGSETTNGGDLGVAGNIDGVLWTFERATVWDDKVKLKFKIANPNDDDERAPSDDVKFIAGNGSEYDPEGLNFPDDLQPGFSEEFELEYKLPADAKPKQGYVKVSVTAGDDEFVNVGLGAPPPTDAQMAKAFYVVATPEGLGLPGKRKVSSKNCSRDDREFDCFFTTGDPEDIVGFEDEDLEYRVRVGGGGHWKAQLTTDDVEFNKGVAKTLFGTGVESGLERADEEPTL